MPNPAVQAHLEGYGINVSKVARRYPPLASYDVERVERVTSYLAGLGVDVRRVVESYSAVLAGRVERYEAVVQLLRDNGVDVVRAVNVSPSILGHRVAGLQRTMDAIAGYGHCVADVVNRNSSVLRSSSSNISALNQLRSRSSSVKDVLCNPELTLQGQANPLVALFSSVGLDAAIFLKRAPQIFSLKPDKLSAVADYLKELGVDVANVLQKAPCLFGCRPAALQQRVQFLSENGLDVVRHVNACPSILGLSVDQKLQPIFTFMVDEMGRSPSELDSVCSIWNCSLEGRLRPRFLYLKSLDKWHRSCGVVVTCTDEYFVQRVARTDLQHYYDWRRLNGYSVPISKLPSASKSGTTAAAHLCPDLDPQRCNA